MAICDWCRQEMLTADDCSVNHQIEYPDGTVLPGIPYFYQKPSFVAMTVGFKHGNDHHPGCDMELCPRCDGQTNLVRLL